MEDRIYTYKEIADELGIPQGSVHAIERRSLIKIKRNREYQKLKEYVTNDSHVGSNHDNIYWD